MGLRLGERLLVAMRRALLARQQVQGVDLLAPLQVQPQGLVSEPPAPLLVLALPTYSPPHSDHRPPYTPSMHSMQPTPATASISTQPLAYTQRYSTAGFRSHNAEQCPV
jgi:hypothetical protein